MQKVLVMGYKQNICQKCKKVFTRNGKRNVVCAKCCEYTHKYQNRSPQKNTIRDLQNLLREVKKRPAKSKTLAGETKSLKSKSPKPQDLSDSKRRQLE